MHEMLCEPDLKRTGEYFVLRFTFTCILAACQTRANEISLQWMIRDVLSIFFSRQIQQGMTRLFSVASKNRK